MISKFWSDLTRSICYVYKISTRDVFDNVVSKVLLIKEITKFNVFQNNDIFFLY